MEAREGADGLVEDVEDDTGEFGLFASGDDEKGFFGVVLFETDVAVVFGAEDLADHTGARGVERLRFLHFVEDVVEVGLFELFGQLAGYTPADGSAARSLASMLLISMAA